MELKIGIPGYKQVLLITGILVVFVLFAIDSKNTFGWDFRNNLWGPAYLLSQKISPYRVDTLFELGNAVWMPTVITPFFPLGLLPLQLASNVWLMINVLCLILVARLASDASRFNSRVAAIATGLCILFPPTITHFRLGQITLLITLIFLVVILKEDTIPGLFSSLLIAIGLAKPQLAILVLPGFLFHKVKEEGGIKTFKFIVLMIISSLMLTVPLFLVSPGWLTDFISALQKNPSWAHPSSMSVLRDVVPAYGTMIWVIWACVVFTLNIWIWKIKPKQEAVLWSLALTPLISPYIWTWDFVVILPLFIHTLHLARHKASLTILYAGYLICWVVIVATQYHGSTNEYSFWWIPWYLVIMILSGRYIENRTQYLSS
jgi:hypothetical protein